MIEDNNLIPNDGDWQGRGYVIPFLLNEGAVRGKLVRLGIELSEIIKKQSYPSCVNTYLGELIALGAALITDMKSEGSMSLQITNGAVIRMIVVEVNHEGHIRGCANVDHDALTTLTNDKQDPKFSALFKGGNFVFTLSMKQLVEKQQAIVELKGDSLAECMLHYFEQSDQVQTALSLMSKLSAIPKIEDEQDFLNIIDLKTGNLLANQDPFGVGCILLQRTPLGEHLDFDEREHLDDNWNTLKILLSTLTENEILSPLVPPDTLLFRLFHEHNPEIFAPKPIVNRCSCSRDRLLEAISHFEKDAIEDMILDEKIEAACQFCGENYIFLRDEIVSAVREIDPLE